MRGQPHLIAAALITTLAPVAALADVYIGLGGLSGSGELELSDSFTSETVEHDNTATQVKIGYVGHDNNRIELSFNSIELDYEGGGTDEFTGFDLDWLITLGSGASVPYLGLGLGYYNFEDTAAAFVDNEDLNGVALNFAIGGIIGLSRNFELELAYKYKYINWQDINFGLDVVETESAISSIYLGANLRF